MERSKVLELLREGPVDIEFVKKDGTLRSMTATLRPESLPKQLDLEETIQKKTPNPDVLAVFDTYYQGWRSFRWDSLKIVNGEKFEQ